jgi:hypothetical protein
MATTLQGKPRTVKTPSDCLAAHRMAALRAHLSHAGGVVLSALGYADMRKAGWSRRALDCAISQLAEGGEVAIEYQDGRLIVRWKGGKVA